MFLVDWCFTKFALLFSWSWFTLLFLSFSGVKFGSIFFLFTKIDVSLPNCSLYWTLNNLFVLDWQKLEKEPLAEIRLGFQIQVGIICPPGWNRVNWNSQTTGPGWAKSFDFSWDKSSFIFKFFRESQLSIKVKYKRGWHKKTFSPCWRTYR